MVVVCCFLSPGPSSACTHLCHQLITFSSISTPAQLPLITKPLSQILFRFIGHLEVLVIFENLLFLCFILPWDHYIPACLLSNLPAVPAPLQPATLSPQPLSAIISSPLHLYSLVACNKYHNFALPLCPVFMFILKHHHNGVFN